ncbi:hypothetical protein GCM10018966_016190 [Streptomyces yanii]
MRHGCAGSKPSKTAIPGCEPKAVEHEARGASNQRPCLAFGGDAASYSNGPTEGVNTKTKLIARCNAEVRLLSLHGTAPCQPVTIPATRLMVVARMLAPKT